MLVSKLTINNKEEEEERLTISSLQEKDEEKEDNLKMSVFLPALALTVVGVGTFWYYRESKKDPRKPRESRIINRLELKEDSRPKNS